MINICNKCGEKIKDIIIVDDINRFSNRKCSNCGNSIKFRKLPIFFLSGASGVGKSTIGNELFQSEGIPFIPIEGDILWNEIYNIPENNYKKYREMWLRLCKNINQGGKPVLLVGCVVPEQIENCDERKYFSETHYIVLTRSEDEIRNSLMARPSFRNSSNENNISDHLSFNNWLVSNADKTSPTMHIIDASRLSIEQTTQAVKELILNLLNMWLVD